MGAPFVMATISAPENLARLDEYRKIQEQLADPRKLGPNPDKKAAELIARGKTIVADHLRHSFDRSRLVSFQHAHRASARFIKRT